MVDKRDQVRGFPLEEPVYDDGEVMAQPFVAADSMVLHNDDGYLAANDEHIEAALEADEGETLDFPEASLRITNSGDELVFDANNGTEMRIGVDALRSVFSIAV